LALDRTRKDEFLGRKKAVVVLNETELLTQIRLYILHR
jgi:hypothetical protein